MNGDEVHDLAEALRRLATLVARGAPPEDMFAAVAEEVHRRFLSDVTIVGRYEPGGAFTILGSAGSLSAGSLFPVGSRWPPGGNNLATRVFETGRPARIENLAEATGRHVGPVREVGIRSAVGTPIIVEDRLWGVMAVGTGRVEPLPSDTEARLASFTELIAMAIANTQARTELAASRARIIAAADETRRQIQRDLHDGNENEVDQHLREIELRARAGGHALRVHYLVTNFAGPGLVQRGDRSKHGGHAKHAARDVL